MQIRYKQKGFIQIAGQEQFTIRLWRYWTLKDSNESFDYENKGLKINPSKYF